MTTRFFVSRGGQVSGPFPMEQVRAWLAQGMTDAYVQPEAGGEWLPILRSAIVARAAIDPAEPSAPVRTIPGASQPVPARSQAPGAGPRSVLLTCLHAVRWCFAAFLATSLSFGLVLVICLSSPINVIDSRGFWATWAERSTLMRGAHAAVDDWLDAASRESQSGAAHATLGFLGDTAAVSRALEKIRPEIHDKMSGQVINAVIGMVTGRDNELQLDVGLDSLRKSTGERFMQAFAAEHCGARNGSSAGCIAGNLALDAGAYDAVWNLISARLGRFNPFSGAFTAHLLPIVGQTRLMFRALRGVLAVAPILLLGLALAVFLSSFRLRTASFMFGCSLTAAGIATAVAGLIVRSVARAVDTSPEVWDLMVERSGAVHAGLGDQHVLLGLGVALLFTRCVGPRWRRSFWTRRLSSSDGTLSNLARDRLSRPAGLLEPVHVLRWGLKK